MEKEKHFENDLIMEKQYESSKNYEKQLILQNLCNPNKYPYDKCLEKIASILGKFLKSDVTFTKT